MYDRCPPLSDVTSVSRSCDVTTYLRVALFDRLQPAVEVCLHLSDVMTYLRVALFDRLQTAVEVCLHLSDGSDAKQTLELARLTCLRVENRAQRRDFILKLIACDVTLLQ